MVNHPQNIHNRNLKIHLGFKIVYLILHYVKQCYWNSVIMAPNLMYLYMYMYFSFDDDERHKMSINPFKVVNIFICYANLGSFPLS